MSKTRQQLEDELEKYVEGFKWERVNLDGHIRDGNEYDTIQYLRSMLIMVHQHSIKLEERITELEAKERQ